jgi:hypothetical protein
MINVFKNSGFDSTKQVISWRAFYIGAGPAPHAGMH